MNHSITLSDAVFKRLDEQARRNQTTPDDMAERLLADLLSGDEHAWRARFTALLARVHARTTAAGLASADIEADITAARSEARAERRARHRPA